MQGHIMDLGMTWMAANQKLPLSNAQSSKDSIPGNSESSILEIDIYTHWPLGLQ